ncbi:uncharacterized protein [Hyperolius riggenbachi]|uniref:uncharacterized protein n=1 Tax=Hyperolius riggenbachi TaxID=752182 RepID=UPI0035A2DFD5
MARTKEEMILTYIALHCSVALALETCSKDYLNLINQQPLNMTYHFGETAVIICELTTNENIKDIHLRRRFQRIISINNRNESMIPQQYRSRLTWSRIKSKFTIELKNLTDQDNDFYVCDGFTEDRKDIFANGTFLFVEKEVQILMHGKDATVQNTDSKYSKQSWIVIVAIIIITCVLLLCLAMYAFVKFSASRKVRNQSTYVDMTQTLRRNTMGNANDYSRAFRK